ncbi:hypothetical protein F4X73_18815 [Candidatus Poribacteria bacterium]|nr:hypothetical protein [Candidatus Poribacteria bacterium]MYB66741.1 hypothetical protein [Candidatus Poribacteria bacterium]MYF54872.1 hypothetical protein [Candidatus Poribacteria bacterium]
MRMKLLVLAYCCILSLSGCILASTPSLNWSENVALVAASSDSRLNDDNMYTQGETSTIREDARDIASQEESDNFTEALLNWNIPQTIQQIVIKAKEGQLEFFEIQYMDDEGEWVTVKEVRDNMRSVYKYTLGKPIVTKKFRLKVPRRWDSRHVGGQSRSRRGETGAPAMAEFRKIQEIELFYALPTPTEGEPTMQ